MAILQNHLQLNRLLIILFLGITLSASIPKDDAIEIPVFKLNFYLMGLEDIDERITVQVGENVEYLNQEFEGKILFKLNRLFMDENHAYIPDLHKAASGKKNLSISSLVDGIEETGSINIYLFETYSEDDSGRAMMGFTPILRRKQDKYEFNSPRFDRMFIAYPGLLDKTTIVHEMGHFLGLSHPWDMHKLDIELMGLDSDEIQHINHMTYSPEVSEFTDQQLSRMQHYALEFRGYLLSKDDVLDLK